MESSRNQKEFSLAYWQRSIFIYIKFTTGAPYTIEYDPHFRQYILQKRSRFFRILTAVLHLWAVLPLLSQAVPVLIKILMDPGGRWPQYYQCFMWFSWIMHLANLLRLLWTRNEEHFVVVCQVGKICKSLSQLGVELPSLGKVKVYSTLLLTACFLWGVLEMLFFDWDIHDRGIYSAYLSTIHNVQDTYGLPPSNNTGTMSMATVMVRTPIIVQLAALIWFLGGFISEHVSHMTELICRTNALIFFWIVKIFTRHLKLHVIEPQHWKLVVEIFNDIIKLTEDIKASFGPVLTGICFLYMPYYTNLVKSILQNLAPVNFLRLGLWMGTCMLFLIIAAEANKMLSGMVSWIRNAEVKDICWSVKYRLEFHEDIIVILSRVESKVGLMGNGFTITYK